VDIEAEVKLVKMDIKAGVGMGVKLDIQTEEVQAKLLV
jgi:hypothetical protein